MKYRGIITYTQVICYQHLQPAPAPPLLRWLEDLSAHLLCVSGRWPTQVRVAVVCTLPLSISSWTAHWSLLILTAMILTPAAALILWGGKIKHTRIYI